MRKIVAVIATAILFAGCSPAPQEVPPQETVQPTIDPTPVVEDTEIADMAFDVIVNEAIDTVFGEGSSDTEAGRELLELLREVGHATCDAFDGGATKEDVVRIIFENAGDDENFVSLFATAAGAGVGAYCPEHLDKL